MWGEPDRPGLLTMLLSYYIQSGSRLFMFVFQVFSGVAAAADATTLTPLLA